MTSTAVAPILYTIAEACQALRMSRTTFYAEVRRGRIRTVPIAGGRFRRVHRDELEAYGRRAQQEADAGR
jgi:excisionase family DNA binding protein